MAEDSSNELYFEIEGLMPDYLQKEAKLEEFIFGLSNESFEDVMSFIRSNGIANDLVFRLIIQAAKVRPFKYKVFGDFWIKMPQTKTRFYSTHFLEYLIQREVIHESQVLNKMYLNQTVNGYENIFPKDSFAYGVIKDDVDLCSFHSTNRGIVNQIIVFEDKKLTPLSLAAYSSSLNVFKFLLVNGAQILAQTCACAVRGGNEEIVEILFQQDFQFDNLLNDAIFYHQNNIAKWIIDNYSIQITNVFFALNACNTLAIWYCIESGVSPNVEDTEHNALINKAIENDQYEIVKYLIQKGANLYSHDSLDLAIKRGQLSIVQLFVENYYILDSVGPLITAIDNKKNDIAKYLIEMGIPIENENDNTNTTLIKAIENEMSDVALLLIEKGANISAINWKNDSVLILAIEMCLSKVAIALINKGVDVNTVNLFGDTPLLKALEKKLIDVALLLIESGENVNEVNLYGIPVITICARNGYYEIIQKLIEHGVNANAKDENGQTALEIAKEKGFNNIVDILSKL